MADEIRKFYEDLQTVPKLIRDLALSVAEAQRALDHDYLENLTEFLKVVRSLQSDGKPVSADEVKALFKLMAPSRHQFTETVCEVRADLQMASSSELGLKGEFGLKGAVFSVAVNASYVRKNAYNAQAAATIKTVIHAVSADPGVMEKLINRAASIPSVEGPKDGRWKEIGEAFGKLFAQLPPAPLPVTPKLESMEPKSVEGGKEATLTIKGTFDGDPSVTLKKADTPTPLTVKKDGAVWKVAVAADLLVKDARTQVIVKSGDTVVATVDLTVT